MFTIALNIVIPVFGIVLIGYLAVKLGVLNQAANEGLSKFVFTIAIPCMLFRAMARADLPDAMPWGFVLSYFLAVLVVYVMGALVAGLVFNRSRAEQGIIGLGSAYSNVVLLGIPMVVAAFGDAAAVPLALMVALHALIMFPLATIILEFGQKRHDKLAQMPLQIVVQLIKSPLILSLSAGLIFNVSGMSIISPVDVLLGLIGQAAPACALVAVGIGLSYQRFGRGDLSEALTIVGTKNLVLPALVWVLGSQVFEVEPLWLSVIVVIATMPTGVNVYLFAKHYGVGEEVISKSIVLSTLVTAFVSSAALVFLSAATPQ